MMNSVQGILLLLVCGVIGAVKDEVPVELMSVYEGESVTLHADTNLLEKDKILWSFKENGLFILLVEMSNYNIKYEDSIDVRLRDRLLISDTRSGDLTIKNMRIKHTGLYRAEINTKTGISYKTFSVTVKESPRYTDAGASVVKSVSVKEGEPVTLPSDEQTQRDDLIQWRFGDKNLLIAKGDMEDNKISVYDDEGFSGRLKLNDQTGDLTITNIRTSNTGVYNLKISSNRETKYKTFSVSVSGWSSGAVAGLCVFFLLVIGAVSVVGVILYRRKKPTGIRSVPEGDTLALRGAKIKLQTGTQIVWKFNDLVILTGVMTEDGVICVTYSDDQQFKDRLELDLYFGHLIIKPILKEDTGLYEVKITNNKETSHTKTQVNVIAEYVTLFEGGNVYLDGADSVLKTGTQIMWKFNNRVIITGVKTDNRVIHVTHSDDQQFKDRLELGNLGYLIINEVSKEDSGVYEVKITYNKQTTHNKTKVNVIGESTKEDFSRQMGDELRLVPEEEILTLVGSHIGTQTGTQIEWKFNDHVIMTGEMTEDKGITEIHSDDQKFKGRLKLNPYFGHLIINNISKEDTGLYEVKITNNKIMLSSRFKVEVIDKALQHLPVDVPVSEGDRVTLPGAYSRPGRGSQIEWTFKGRVIMTGEMTMKGMTGIHSDDQQFKDRLGLDYNFGSLFIKNISKKDAGLYEGKITKVTKPLHFKIKVNVIDKIMSVAEGDSLILPGTKKKLLIGTKIEWKFNNRVITTGNMTQDAGIIKMNGVHQQFNGRLKQDPFRGSLTINNISKEDIGLYEVNITNKNETSHNRFHVDVIVSPRTNKNEPEPTAGMPLLSV